MDRRRAICVPRIMEEGQMTHTRPRLFVSIAVSIICCASLALSQNPAEKQYAELQQATRMMPIFEEIATVEDPVMRIHLRSTILSFVYTQRIAGVYDIADVEVKRLFEDIAANRKLLSDLRVSLWLGQMMVEMRKSRPSLASELEAMLTVEDIARIDLNSLSVEPPPPPATVLAVATRLMARIRSGEKAQPGRTPLRLFVDRIHKRDPAIADRVLTAALEQDEKVGDAANSYTFSLVLNVSPLPPTESAELRKRFLTIIFNYAKKSIAGPEPDRSRAGVLLGKYKNVLREFAPEYLAEAVTLHDAYLAGRSATVIKYEETQKRLLASEDPIAAALLEVDKEEDANRKLGLIQFAVGQAVLRKEFDRAVDALMLSPPHSSAMENYRDYQLYRQIGVQALEAKDYDAVAYVLSRFEDPGYRASFMGEVASRKVREPNNTAEVNQLIHGAFKLLETNPVTNDSPSHAFRSVYPAFFLGNIEGFDAARRAIAIINKLPAPTAEQKPGGKEYQRYSDTVGVGVAGSLTAVFGWIMSREPDVAVFRVQEIRSRPYKLAAMIAIERGRQYKLPTK